MRQARVGSGAARERLGARARARPATTLASAPTSCDLERASGRRERERRRLRVRLRGERALESVDERARAGRAVHHERRVAAAQPAGEPEVVEAEHVLGAARLVSSTTRACSTGIAAARSASRDPAPRVDQHEILAEPDGERRPAPPVVLEGAAGPERDAA